MYADDDVTAEEQTHRTPRATKKATSKKAAKKTAKKGKRESQRAFRKRKTEEAEAVELPQPTHPTTAKERQALKAAAAADGKRASEPAAEHKLPKTKLSLEKRILRIETLLFRHGFAQHFNE